MNPIDAGKIYEYLEQVGTPYPRFADNIVDNAVSNVINDIKTFIASLQQERPSKDLEKEIKEAVYEPLLDLGEGNIGIVGGSGFITIDDIAGIARYFYELGLKARKV